MPDLDTIQAKSLYDAVSAKLDIGTYDEYLAKMQTLEERKSFFDVVSTKFDIGDYTTYENTLKKKGSTESLSQGGTLPSQESKTPISDLAKQYNVSEEQINQMLLLPDIDLAKMISTPEKPITPEEAAELKTQYLSEKPPIPKTFDIPQFTGITTPLEAPVFGENKLKINQVTGLNAPDYTTVPEAIKDIKEIKDASPTEVQDALKALGRKDYDVSPENLQISLAEKNFLKKVLTGEKTAGENPIDDYLDKNFGTDWSKVKESYAGKQIESVAQSIQQIKKAVNTPDPDFWKNTTNILKNSINIVFSAIPAAQVFMAVQEGVIQASAAYEAAINNDPSILEDNKGTFRDIIDYGMTLPTQQFKNLGLLKETKEGEIEEATASNLAGFMDIAWQMFFLHGTGKVIEKVKSLGTDKSFTRTDLEEISKTFKPLNDINDKIAKKEPITKEDITVIVDEVKEIKENPEHIKTAIESNPDISDADKQAFADKIELDKQIKELQVKHDTPTTPELFIDKDTQATLDNIDANKPVLNTDLQAASTNLYNEYKRLETIKISDTRQVTIDKINAAQWSLGEAVSKLEEKIATQKETGEFDINKIPKENIIKPIEPKTDLTEQKPEVVSGDNVQQVAANEATGVNKPVVESQAPPVVKSQAPPVVKSKEVVPAPEVKTDVSTVIDEVVSDKGKTYGDIDNADGNILYGMKDKPLDAISYDKTDSPEIIKSGEQQDFLEKQGYIEQTYDDGSYELTTKGKEFVDAVDARLETRKGVKEGTDLFPEDANIPELKTINEELKTQTDGNTINKYEQRTADEVSQSEPVIKNIESKSENAENLSDKELQDGINQADELLKPAEQKPVTPEQKLVSETGEPEKKISLKEKEEDFDVSLKRAVADENLENLSGTKMLDQMKDNLQSTDIDAIFNQAKQDIVEGKTNPESVTEKIIKDKKGTTEDEATLLIEMGRLKTEENTIFDRLNDEPENRESLLKEQNENQKKQEKNFLAAAILGREASNIFRLRQAYLNKEMSLSYMEKQYKAGKGIKDLTPEQSAEIKAVYEQLKTQEAEVRKQEAIIEQMQNEKIAMQNLIDEARKYKKEKPKDTTPVRKGKDLIAEGTDELMAALGLSKSFAAEKTPAITKALAKIGKGLIDEGLATIDNVMVKIKEYIEDKFAGKIDFEKYKDKVEKQLDKWKPETTEGEIKIPTKVLKELVGEGYDTIETLVKKVNNHEDAAKWGITTETTERQIRDAITNYGKQKRLSKDEIDTKLREIKRIGLLTTKLEEAKAKRRALKTGIERDTPTKQERDMQKELNKLLKDIPLEEEAAKNKLKTSLDAIKTRLNNQIEDLQVAIDTKVKINKETKKTEYDTETTELIEQRDTLKKTYDETFGKTELTDEQKIQKVLDSIDKSEAEVNRKIKELDLEKKKTNKIETPEIKARREQLNERRKVLKQLREEAGIAEKEWNERQIKSVNKRKAILEEKIKNKDYETKKRQPVKYAISPEHEAARADLAQTQLSWELARAKDAYSKMHWFEKTTDRIIKFRTAVGLLTGIRSFAKIIHFSLLELAYGEPMDIITSGVAKLLPNKLAERSMTEGHINWLARKQFVKTYFNKKTWNDAKSYLTKNSRTHELYKRATIRTPEMTLSGGRLHGFEKYPLWKAEFDKQSIIIADHFYKNGFDVSKPEVRKMIDALAGDKANYRILMGKNRFSSLLKNSQGWMYRQGRFGKAMYYTSKVLFPIMSVPTNYTIKTLRSWGGIFEFALRVAIDGTGKEKMTPEQIDKGLLAFKNGLPGAALAILTLTTELVTVNEDDDMVVGGMVMPKFLTHHPALFTLKLFAEAKKEFQKEKGTFGSAAFTVVQKTIQEIPYFGDRAFDMMDSSDKFDAFTQNLILSLAQPQLVKDIASMTDKERLTLWTLFMENPPKRYPDKNEPYLKQLFERAKLGIPVVRETVLSKDEREAEKKGITVTEYKKQQEESLKKATLKAEQKTKFIKLGASEEIDKETGLSEIDVLLSNWEKGLPENEEEIDTERKDDLKEAFILKTLNKFKQINNSE